jgi:hypothetical protein
MILLGLVVMVVSEAATLAHIEPFWSWNTPIAWTGFILFADGVVWRARHQSWIRSTPREFLFLSLVSIPLWLVFEFYNRFIENWHYVGLPEDRGLRYFGYAWSFATIWPAIFEGAELVAVSRARRRPGQPWILKPGPISTSRVKFLTRLSIAIGAALLIWPLAWPSQYLAAPVWLGFIFLLDPINARLGEESLIKDLVVRRDPNRLVNLMLSGVLCGVLWEFWNYWSRAKWVYTVPLMERLKIFEMPVPGYLGFPAFALECFTMYIFLRIVVLGVTGSNRLGRTIAL